MTEGLKPGFFDDANTSKFSLWEVGAERYDMGPVIITGLLGKKKHSISNIQLRPFHLTSKYLYYTDGTEKKDQSPKRDKGQQPKGVIRLENVRVKALFNSPERQGHFTCSILIIKNLHFTELFFENKDQQEVWMEHLRPLTVQVDFHSRFRITKVLSSGEFRSVLMVEHRKTNLKYFCKMIKLEDLELSQEQIQAVKLEVAISRAVEHKHLLKFVEIDETDKCLFLVLEYPTSADIFSIDSPIDTLQDVKTVMVQLLEGLKALHSSNVMHRDIRPNNLLFDRKNMEGSFSLKICDFGLASFVTGGFKSPFVKCGAPGFAAPEVINSDSKNGICYSQKCDIFSAGCIFYQLLTGDPLFSGDSLGEIYQSNKLCMIELDHPELRDYDHDCLRLLSGMLQNCPDNRLSAAQCLESPFLSASIKIDALKTSNKIPNGLLKSRRSSKADDSRRSQEIRKSLEMRELPEDMVTQDYNLKMITEEDFESEEESLDFEDLMDNLKLRKMQSTPSMNRIFSETIKKPLYNSDESSKKMIILQQVREDKKEEEENEEESNDFSFERADS